MTERSEDRPISGDATTVNAAASPATVVLDGAEPTPAVVASSERPRTIGRYRVTGELGRGGMGVVYEAHDPKLDRTVAIKLVRPTHAGSQARERLGREARVLARLSHPNVVEVFEIGEHEGQLFIAMELVRGRDLRRWRDANEPDAAQILTVLTDAGRGLAAAHAAGLIHRDFKPDNVMVGDDGRVRVLDFGLARAALAMPSTVSQDGAPPDPAPSASSSEGRLVHPEDRLTITGLAMGTPAYMAPEQFRQAVDDPRADQFAFGVALFEMLAGRRPFKGRSYEELAKKTAQGEIDEPHDHAIPRPIFRVILRSLAPAPEDRFPDMQALLEALTRARRPSRGPWVVGGVLLATASTAGALWLARPPAEAPCPTVESLRAEVWDEATRDAIREAILGTELAYAEPTWTQVDAALGRYADAWAQARHATCDQLRNRSPAPEPQAASPAPSDTRSDLDVDQRLACLQHRRLALAAALEALRRADGSTVHNAQSTVARLPAVAGCDRPSWRGRIDTASADPRLEPVERALATATARFHMGRYADGMDAITTLGETLAALEPAPPPRIVAAYQLVRGQLARALGRALSAAEAFEAAYFAAVESEQLDLACRAASLVAAEPAVPYRERWQWAGHARAALERHGEDPAVATHYEAAMCRLQSDSGALDEAIAHCERALAIAEDREPAQRDPQAIARALADLGAVMADAEDRERSYALRERALELAERAWGPAHPRVADAANDLGFAALALDRADEAAALAQRALEIRRATLGPDHPDVVLAEALQLELHMDRKQYAEAEALARRGLDLRRRAYGDTHPLVAKSQYSLALALERRGEPEAALDAMRRVAEIDEQLHPLNLERLPTLREQARMAFEIGAGPSEGVQHLERAWAIVRDSEIPDDHPMVLDLCHGYGETLLALGEAERALPYLRRFVEGRPDSPIGPHLRFVLARAIAASGGDIEQARAIVLQAIDAWEGSAEPFHQQQVADMRAWLAGEDVDAIYRDRPKTRRAMAKPTP